MDKVTDLWHTFRGKLQQKSFLFMVICVVLFGLSIVPWIAYLFI